MHPMQAARRQDGAVMVEFALVCPLLLFLVIGFLQYGIAMNAKIDSTHLTAEGARYIAVNQNPGLSDPLLSPKTMQNYIRSRADTSALKAAQVCISYPVNPETSTSGKVGDPVLVTMQKAYGVAETSGLGALLASTLPVTIQVHSEATMRLEALPVKIPAGCLT
jgi:Flp pilus assembly protein TadG